ncbi:MAG: ABC transporter permease [Micrococcales bacterium]
MKLVRRALVWAAPLVFIGVLFYWPAGRLLGLGFDQLVTSGVATDHHTLPTVWFTVWQALLSSALCLPVGLAGAYLLYRKSFPGQSFLRAVSLIPFMLPVVTIGIAFSTFQNGNTSFWWIILAHVFINAPLTIRVVGSHWITLDPEIEEASELAGAGRWRTFWSITFPQLRSSVASSMALTTVYCLASFGVVLILGSSGTQTIETLIYQSAVRELDLARASLLCLLQLGLTAGVFIIASRLGRVSPLLTQATRSSSTRLDGRDFPLGIIGVLLGLLALIPVGSLVIRAFTYDMVFSLQNFANLLTTGTRELLSINVVEATGNSLRNTAIATALAMIVGFAVSYLLTHSHSKFGILFLRLAYVVPLGVSTVLLGLGYLIGFSQPPFELRSSWLVIPLAQSLIALPLVVRLLTDSLKEVPVETREAAALDGASEAQVWWHVELALTRPTIAAAAGFAAVMALGDFGAASFLSFGEQETLPVVLYSLIARPGGTNYGMAMAASALLMVAVTVVVLAVSWRPKRANQDSLLG